MSRLPYALLFGCTLIFVGGSTAGASVKPSVVTRAKDAGRYHLVFDIGPAEMMGMHGERMISGKAARCRMPMKGMREEGVGMHRRRCNHHIELHVYSKDSMHVVKGAHVSIHLRCRTMHMNYKVPIEEMENSKTGARDYHYGNNMHLMKGMYDAHVAVNGTRIRFALLSVH